MTKPKTVPHESYPDTHHDTYSRTLFGFWMYLLSDFILFGSLFATYVVLRDSTFGGPSAADLFHLPYALVQTLILLVSSFTIGIGAAFAHRNNKNWTIILFAITLLLGCVFVGMEFAGFKHLVDTGNGWQRSAFLSGFFTLVGTHGIHMLFAILWILVLIVPVCKDGLTSASIRRLSCLKMFWQFLNIVWIFIFSFVYLMGVK